MDFNIMKDVRINNWHKTIVDGINRAKDRNEIVYKIDYEIARKIPDEVINMLITDGYEVNKVNNNGLFIKW